MKRRDVLATAAVSGGSLLAGCAGIGDSNGGGTDVGARIDEAIEFLVENDEELDELDGDDPPDSFDATSMHDRADDAEAALDEGEGDASDEQQETIDVLRATATFQREAGDYGERWVEFDNCLDTVDAYVGNEEWQAASDEFGRCNGVLDDLSDQLQATIDALDAVDTDRLASEADIEYDDPDEELWLVAEELDALGEYLDGLERFVAGVAHFVDGQEEIEAENWGTAASIYEDARTDFEASATTMRDLEDDPDTPGQFRSDVVELRCSAEAFTDASDEMVLGANDADRGNYTSAEEHFQAADQAADRCQ